MKISRVVFALAAAFSLTQLQAQAIYKCVGADGKTSYSNSRCPNAKQIRGGSSSPLGAASASSLPDVSKLPAMEPGKWTWSGVEGEACGDPLESLRQAISTAYTNAARMGCKAQLAAPAPRNVVFIMDCPDDRSEDGMNYAKGTTEITAYSPSPQLVRVSTKAPGGPTQVAEAKRLGDCNN